MFHQSSTVGFKQHGEELDSMAAKGPASDIVYPAIHFVPSGNCPEIDLGAPVYDGDKAETRRSRNLTKRHTIREKMELYTSSTKGKLEDLRDALGKEYSITEEISKCGYYWTILHYASHYGHYEILIYLIEMLDNHPNKHEIYNMQTTEGKTPLFCAVLSGDIKQPDK